MVYSTAPIKLVILWMVLIFVLTTLTDIKCVTWDLTSGNYLQVSGELSQELTGPGRVFVRARVDGLLWDQHGQVEGVVLEKDQLRVKAPWVAARRHFKGQRCEEFMVISQEIGWLICGWLMMVNNG